jgi:hypothetical protein
MKNLEWEKASDKLEETIKQFEYFIFDMKSSHFKMKIEMLKNIYLFQKNEYEYIKKINELEEKLNDKKFEYPPILGYPPIIDAEVE